MLTPNEFGVVQTLADMVGAEYPIIRAVLENRQDGQVLADHRATPTCAIVCHKSGFLTVLASPDSSPPLAEVLDVLLHGEELTPKYRLWYDPSACFMPALLPHIDAGRARVRERVRYGFSGVGETAAEPTVGWTLRALERRDMPALSAFRLGFPERFWRSADDFLGQAFAVVAEQNGEIAAICYPAAIGSNRAEIDVATLEHARGKRLATVVSQKFIQESLRRNVAPTWDCFIANEPSVRLAQRLGFKEMRRYQFVTFNRM